VPAWQINFSLGADNCPHVRMLSSIKKVKVSLCLIN
jgi:hypothetical protein